jgi:hypothetical protein
VKSFKNKHLQGFSPSFGLQSAMMAFSRQCKLHGKCSRSIAGRLPTLKKPTDDMTNQGLAVNMHAVRRAVSGRDNSVSQ